MEVPSSTSYLVQRSFTINPGNSNTFPWLARLANSYQQYRVRGMVFHYVPTSGSLSSGTSNALGSVMLQTSYRANDAAPSTKVELLNEFWSTESPPMDAFAHPIECNPNENPFNVQYVKSNSAIIPAGDSPLLYDLGVTHVATSGQQASGVALGDLWVTYEIELKKPIIASNVTSSAFLFAAYSNVSTPTFANPFGVGTSNEGNIAFTTTASRQIVLPAVVYGEFWLLVVFKGASALTNPTVVGAPTLTNCTLSNWSYSQDRYEQNVAAGGTSGNLIYGVRIFKGQRESAATITIPQGSATAGTLGEVQITVFGAPIDVP